MPVVRAAMPEDIGRIRQVKNAGKLAEKQWIQGTNPQYIARVSSPAIAVSAEWKHGGSFRYSLTKIKK